MFAERIEQIDRLLTLPQVVYKINEVVESKTASATDLHRVIKADPALSSKLLRLVNSAYYGLPCRVASVEKAIVLIGMAAVKNLAVVAGVEQMFRRVTLPGPLTGRDLWVHCLAVATCGRELGQHAGLRHLDDVFMGGLIHDLGMLAAAQVEPQDFGKVVQACMGGQTPWLVAEQEILGVTHAEAGARLAERWHFPEKLVELIRHHHDSPLDAETPDLAGLIYLADTAASGLSEGFTLSGQSQTLEPEMLSRYGISPADFSSVWQNLPAHVDELAGILQV